MEPQKSPYLVRDLTALVLLIAGIGIASVALFLPPPGEIHESVLFIFAQILIYAGSIFGIDAYIRKSINGSPSATGQPIDHDDVQDAQPRSDTLNQRHEQAED